MLPACLFLARTNIDHPLFISASLISFHKHFFLQLVVNNVRFLVNSMNGLTAFTHGHLHHSWTGLILLPIAGNVADHIITVSHTFKDDLDLAISLAFGASVQMALLVIPFLVLLGWMMDKPLNLLFDPFQSIVLFLTSKFSLSLFFLSK